MLNNDHSHVGTATKILLKKEIEIDIRRFKFVETDKKQTMLNFDDSA